MVKALHSINLCRLNHNFELKENTYMYLSYLFLLKNVFDVVLSFSEVNRYRTCIFLISKLKALQSKNVRQNKHKLKFKVKPPSGIPKIPPYISPLIFMYKLPFHTV